MDEGIKFAYEEVLPVAQRVLEVLAPFCERIEIAGSIRRKSPLVKDIEIVCIPKPYDVDMFASGIALAVQDWPCINGKLKPNMESRYTKRLLPELITLDLFMCKPENWGWIFAVRTGSAEFSRDVLVANVKRAGYDMIEGMIYHKGREVECKEEKDLFTLMGLPYIEPEHRKHQGK